MRLQAFPRLAEFPRAGTCSKKSADPRRIVALVELSKPFRIAHFLTGKPLHCEPVAARLCDEITMV